MAISYDDVPATGTAADFLPATRDLPALAAAAQDCRGCRLYAHATQAVFGTGPAHARVVLLGEQPGDVEDRRGEPFVGPAGKLLDRALDEAGIDRGFTYVTNAVKHFKFTQTAPGKRRIHATPDRHEVAACRPWLDAELAVLRPEVVVLLGATAAKAVHGPSFRVMQQRGALLPWPDRDPVEGEPADGGSGDGAAEAPVTLATVHPSAVLRASDRDAALAGLVADLRVVADALR